MRRDNFKIVRIREKGEGKEKEKEGHIQPQVICCCDLAVDGLVPLENGVESLFGRISGDLCHVYTSSNKLTEGHTAYRRKRLHIGLPRGFRVIRGV